MVIPKLCETKEIWNGTRVLDQQDFTDTIKYLLKLRRGIGSCCHDSLTYGSSNIIIRMEHGCPSKAHLTRRVEQVYTGAE